MLAWLAALALADDPDGSAAPRPLLYVVDAYVVRSVTFDLMGIRWTGDRRPPGTTREVRYCVSYDRPPLGEDTVVAREWVAVGVAGIPLTVDQFASATGVPSRRSRGRSMLGGVQAGYTREQAEAAAAVASAELTPQQRSELRRRVLAGLPGPSCSEALPAAIGEP
jgi:hypothetical protein